MHLCRGSVQGLSSLGWRVVGAFSKRFAQHDRFGINLLQDFAALIADLH